MDLTFTGTHDFSAIGTSGQCSTAASGPAYHFGFQASETDYPGLGVSFNLDESAPGYVFVKWLLTADTIYSRPGPAHGGSDSDLVLSADKHTLTLDVELEGQGVQGGPQPGPVHVTGTVVCP